MINIPIGIIIKGLTNVWENTRTTHKRSNLSGPLNVLQVPPPHGLTVEFYYNFYTPDETLNAQGYGADFAGGKSNTGKQLSGGTVSFGDVTNPNVNTSDSEYLFQIEKVAPRMVKIQFQGSTLVANPDYIDSVPSMDEGQFEDNEAFIRSFLTDAMDESAVASASSTMDFCSLTLQDDDAGIDIVNQAIFSDSLRDDFDRQGASNVLAIKVDNLFTKPHFVLGSQMIGKTDFGTWVPYSKRPQPVSSTFIQAAVASFNAQGSPGTAIFNLATGDRKGTDFKTDLSQVQLTSQLNYKIAGDIMTHANNTPVTPYVDSICVDAPHANLIQSRARELKSQLPSIQGSNDFDIDLPDLTSQVSLMIALGEKAIPQGTGTQANNTAPSHPGKIKVLGYVLEKFEILPGGRKKRLQTRVFGSPDMSSGIDTKVRVGATYHYQARTAVLYEFDAIDAITNKMYRAMTLMLSRPSNVAAVDCAKSTKPPDPPGDIRFVWDYDKEFLHVYWAFPVEKERDVKYFQVFRRKTINEPFQLLAEYDFNDNLGSFTRGEYIRPSLITKMITTHGQHAREGAYKVRNIKTFYTDAEFKKDSVYIYAIVALDAYGHSSNYSDQFFVYFDRTLNKIRAEGISPAGAPLTYPNFFMKSNVDGFQENTNITEDLIRSSLAKKMTVYFSPEALKVTSNSVNQNHLAFSAIGDDKNFDNNIQYLMQLTNLDRQSTRVVPIHLQKITEDI